MFYIGHFRESGEGAENDTVRLCNALAKRGHSVSVACRDGSPTASVSLHTCYDDPVPLRTKLVPDLVVDMTFSHPADVYRLGGGLHRDYLPYAMEAYGYFGRKLKELRSKFGRHAALCRKQEKLIHLPDAYFLPISRFAGKRLIEARPDRVSVLYNGVENERFDPSTAATTRADFRASIGAEPDTLVCLWVAHNLHLKNLDLAVDICRRLHAQGRKVMLVVAGKRHPKKTADWLHWVGRVSDMERLYAGADVLLHPTYYDAFGNVVLEAMSAGIPALVSDCAGAAELIEHGRNGLVLPVSGNQVDTWCQALDDLYTDPNRRLTIGLEARRTALAHDFRGYVDRFEELLHKVLEQRSKTNQGK